MQKNILFVDDEIQILKSIQRFFIDYDYQIFTAASGSEGLEILENNRIDLVISDYSMPKMDGIQFLEIVRIKSPETLRVILSGYLNEKTVLKAVQKNIAKQYLYKPWENETLLKFIEQIFQTEEQLKEKNLLNLINNIEELPTIKSSFHKVVSLIEGDASSTRIAEAIEEDQSLTTKILHVANSAFYRLSTGSVAQAVAYLGVLNLKNIIMTTAIIDQLTTKVKSENMELFWRHAYLTNKIMTFTYEKVLKKKLPEIASVAGLLHNIGIVVLLYYYPEKYQQVLDRKSSEKVEIIKIEGELLNVNHQQVGGYLLNWWQLPLPIVESAIYHHVPLDPKIINKDLLVVVHLAQYFAWRMMGIGVFCSLDARVLELLNINEEDYYIKLQENVQIT